MKLFNLKPGDMYLVITKSASQIEGEYGWLVISVEEKTSDYRSMTVMNLWANGNQHPILMHNVTSSKDDENHPTMRVWRAGKEIR